MNNISPSQEKKYRIGIAIVSIVIPALVAFLLYVPQTGKLGDFDVSFLPHLNGGLNSATSILLLLGAYAIKVRKDPQLHRIFMGSAILVSVIFLLSYVLYHFQGSHTIFGDVNHDMVVSEVEAAQVGAFRYVYLFILLTHIVLATIIVPLVLFSVYYAVTNQLEKHKKWVKFTFPIWLYVAVTGVVVYWMISQYY